jgi:hypothetical protein
MLYSTLTLTAGGAVVQVDVYAKVWYETYGDVTIRVVSGLSWECPDGTSEESKEEIDEIMQEMDVEDIYWREET